MGIIFRLALFATGLVFCMHWWRLPQWKSNERRSVPFPIHLCGYFEIEVAQVAAWLTHARTEPKSYRLLVWTIKRYCFNFLCFSWARAVLTNAHQFRSVRVDRRWTLNMWRACASRRISHSRNWPTDDSWRLVAWYRQRFLSDNLKREYKSLIHSYSIEYKKGEDCKWVSFCSELWSCRQLRHINILCFYGKDRIHPFLFMTIETSRGLIP